MTPGACQPGEFRARTALWLIGLALLGWLGMGCTSATEYGECVGVQEDRNPAMSYKVDVGNVVVAVIFSETIVVPLVVVLDELWCPVAQRADGGGS